MAEPMIVKLTQPRKLDHRTFVTPPDWLVRMVSVNHGKKVRKYPSTWNQTGYHSPYGYDTDGLSGPWGMDHSEAYEHWRQAEARRQGHEAKMVVRGNLTENQYRFWNGSSSMASNHATCRWCRHWAYGPEEMRKHQDLTDHTRILTEVYDFARKHDVKMCFTCGARTRHQRWGIPICNQNLCLNKWRVAPIVEVSATLLLYTKLAFAKGRLRTWLNEDRSEKANIEANPKPFNWERANAY